MWIDPEARLVRGEAWGSFTTDELLTVIDDLVDDPAYDPTYNGLSDHRRVTRPISPAQLYRLIVHIRQVRDRIAPERWAVVTGSLAAYGMARMMSVYAERLSIDLRPFHDMDEALEWLFPDPEQRARVTDVDELPPEMRRHG
jgi:hypothetical protein